MNILHTVELYHPIQGGAQEVIRMVSERLVRSGHTVTIATSRVKHREIFNLNGVNIVEFGITGNSVRGISEEKEGEVARYIDFVRKGNFDIMMNYAAQQWTVDCIMPYVHQLPFPSVLAPCGFSGLYNPEYSEYFVKLPDYLRTYSAHILHSAEYRDAQFYKENNIPFTVITNAASENEFSVQSPFDFRKRHGIDKSIPMLLTVGSHTGLKGHRLVIESFRQADIGRAVLVVIGNTVGKDNCLIDCKRRAIRSYLYSLGKKRVLVLDPPRDEVVAAYQAADLFVFGSNIECSPLVLFESIASGTPFLATNAGNSSEIAQWSEAGIIVESEEKENGYVYTTREKFARAIEQMFSDRKKLVIMSEKGKQRWSEHFTWKIVAERYENLYRDTISQFQNQ